MGVGSARVREGESDGSFALLVGDALNPASEKLRPCDEFGKEPFQTQGSHTEESDRLHNARRMPICISHHDADMFGGFLIGRLVSTFSQPI
mmetsp:Transcript_11111/g.24512  ORF Transcript_11111/g.24512 Transcript_11111/m.24512 type:complete len:91 (-) Transcript_11111:537-809(-)|eukprot:CAMPEP_0206457424 /NCGR_PEP_ID=MMETSP0324_2-20121206/22950_1 /ASSEMBLY_ACC=CAM_ASM_000836 /TAXON_ID=2866 /ORGANISM="Crypthecodinium cohnii, Strain Seligo" /LENGTH=90 /DNA_ID=CAMNT_0053928537 /DNA_START=414 /DNA_END=686 /DNA_ORIENTATION=-